MALRCVLLFPCPRRYRSEPGMNLVPTGLLSMGALLANFGHRVTVAHMMRMTRRDALSLALEADLVGISCFTFQRRRALEFAEEVKRRAPGAEKPFVVLGGPHATPLCEEILRRCPFVDGVVLGEGEEVLKELAARLAEGVSPEGIPGLVLQGRPDSGGAEIVRVPDLDSLPFPGNADMTITGVDRRLQLRHVMTARGCAFACRFCEAPYLCGRRVRKRSLSNLLRELEALKERWGLLYFSFRDDSFSADRERLREFCREILQRRLPFLWDCQCAVAMLDPETVTLMRRAGCVQIQLGIESGSQEVLKTLGKNYRRSELLQLAEACRKTGMLLSAYIITGVPGETARDVTATEALLRELRVGSVVVSRLALYPGTELGASVPPDRWFTDLSDSIFAREDPEAVSFEERLKRFVPEADFTSEHMAEAARALEDAPPALLALGTTLENEGKAKEAEGVYQKLLAAHADHPWALLALGELCLSEKRAAEAETYLRRLVELVPTWPYALNRLGWSLMAQGKKREGERLLDEALALEPLYHPPPPDF